MYKGKERISEREREVCERDENGMFDLILYVPILQVNRDWSVEPVLS